MAPYIAIFQNLFPDFYPAVFSTDTVLIHICILLSEWQCILDTTHLQLGSLPQCIPAARAPLEQLAVSKLEGSWLYNSHFVSGDPRDGVLFTTSCRDNKVTNCCTD